MLAGAVAVANFYGFLLRRLTLTTASLGFLYAAPRVNSDSRACSAKLVRKSEITANFHRCKNFLRKIEKFCQEGQYGGNAEKQT
jgi:hypothetical protein